MTIVKRILSGLVIFIAGLEAGAFGMWWLTTKLLNESGSRRATRNYHKLAEDMRRLSK